ncbi:hypothetical protein PYCC9005_005855 [Savitreella phatthalungensis]
MLRARISVLQLASRSRVAWYATSSSTSDGNAGRKGPLTGGKKKKSGSSSAVHDAGDGNAGRRGPLTGGNDVQGLEGSDGGHATPHRTASPGESGKGDGGFVEQGASAIDVDGGAPDALDKGHNKQEQKVDSAFWANDKTQGAKSN